VTGRAGRARVPVPPSHPQPPGQGGWPLYNHLPFGPLRDSVPTARIHPEAVLREWGLRRAALADILTVMSELVSNAVQASAALPQARPLRVWTSSDGARVLIQAGDESPARPVIAAPDVEAEHGRGLLVAQALSSAWAWFPATSHSVAKVVWADLPNPSMPAPCKGMCDGAR
jgi:anti-sigma regulatory factor (Ser/Thr protein kinase)